MTTFDPAFAREVLERRQAEKLREGSQLLTDKFIMQIEGEISPWGPRADVIDKKVKALWAEADSYDSVLAYLDDRIWEEMKPAERIWSVMKDWDFRTGPSMVGDVLTAQHIASAGRTW